MHQNLPQKTNALVLSAALFLNAITGSAKTLIEAENSRDHPEQEIFHANEKNLYLAAGGAGFLTLVLGGVLTFVLVNSSVSNKEKKDHHDSDQNEGMHDDRLTQFENDSKKSDELFDSQKLNLENSDQYYIGRSTVSHFSDLRYAQIPISGQKNRCWMRTAWFMVFSHFSRLSDGHTLLADRLAHLAPPFDHMDEIDRAYISSSQFDEDRSLLISHINYFLKEPNHGLSPSSNQYQVLNSQLEIEEAMSRISRLFMINEQFKYIIDVNGMGSPAMIRDINQNLGVDKIPHASTEDGAANGVIVLGHQFNASSLNPTNTLILNESNKNQYKVIALLQGVHWEPIVLLD